LKRKGDVLVRTYIKLNRTSELLGLLVSLMQNDSALVRSFSMYCFEVLAELNLNA
jgi:hypothetical protein